MAQFWRSFCLNRAQNRVILAAVIASFYLAKAHITTHNNQLIWPNWRCADDNIVTGTGDHDKNQYARGPEDDLQADLPPYHVGCRVLPTVVAGVAGTNLYLKYGFVPPHRISIKASSHSFLVIPNLWGPMQVTSKCTKLSRCKNRDCLSLIKQAHQTFC